MTRFNKIIIDFRSLKIPKKSNQSYHLNILSSNSGRPNSKTIPNFLCSLRYPITCKACSRCPSRGITRCCDKKSTSSRISTLINYIYHRSCLIISWYHCISSDLIYAVSSSSGFYPERIGVRNFLGSFSPFLCNTYSLLLTAALQYLSKYIDHNSCPYEFCI